MKIDAEKIQRYLLEIKARHYEIDELLRGNSDPEILEKPWVLKGLKYTYQVHKFMLLRNDNR